MKIPCADDIRRCVEDWLDSHVSIDVSHTHIMRICKRHDILIWCNRHILMQFLNMHNIVRENYRYHLEWHWRFFYIKKRFPSCLKTTGIKGWLNFWKVQAILYYNKLSHAWCALNGYCCCCWNHAGLKWACLMGYSCDIWWTFYLLQSLQRGPILFNATMPPTPGISTHIKMCIVSISLPFHKTMWF